MGKKFEVLNTKATGDGDSVLKKLEEESLVFKNTIDELTTSLESCKLLLEEKLQEIDFYLIDNCSTFEQLLKIRKKTLFEGREISIKISLGENPVSPDEIVPIKKDYHLKIVGKSNVNPENDSCYGNHIFWLTDYPALVDFIPEEPLPIFLVIYEQENAHQSDGYLQFIYKGNDSKRSSFSIMFSQEMLSFL